VSNATEAATDGRFEACRRDLEDKGYDAEDIASLMGSWVAGALIVAAAHERWGNPNKASDEGVSKVISNISSIGERVHERTDPFPETFDQA